MMFYSDDPVRDFERFDAYRERVRERHRIGRCKKCGEAVYDYEPYTEAGFELYHDECVENMEEE